jgi:hypothetical protein
MRQLIGFVLAASAVLTTGCNKSNAQNAPTSGKTIPHFMIVPGPVTGSRAAGINATFKLVQATVGQGGEGITSDQLGGACILFRAADLGYTQMAAKSCTTQEDCATGEGLPYCEGGQCWARPDPGPDATIDPLCRKSGDTTPATHWPINQPVQIADPGPIPAPANLRPNAQARLLACLRGKGTSQLCGKPHTEFAWGSPSTIP